MNGRVLLVLSILMAPLVPAFGQAAKSDGRPDPSTPEEIHTMHEYASCVAERNSGEAKRILSLDFRRPEAQRALRMLTRERSRCFRRGAMRFNELLLLGGMAESLLEKRLAGRSLTTEVSAASTVEARSAPEAMAQCVVLAAPGEVSALLATAPAGAEEAAVIRKLQPQLGSCLPKGVEAELNRPGLRSLLAISAYRLTTEASVRPAAKNVRG